MRHKNIYRSFYPQPLNPKTTFPSELVILPTKELRELINLPDSSKAPLDSSILTPPPDFTLTRQ